MNKKNYRKKWRSFDTIPIEKDEHLKNRQLLKNNHKCKVTSVSHKISVVRFVSLVIAKE